MKKILSLSFIFIFVGAMSCAAENYVNTRKLKITANAKLTETEYAKAQKIILNIHKKTEKNIQKGYGPFYAEIYDEKGNFIAGASNSVVSEGCSNNHAETNTIKAAEKKLKTYDLSPYNLTIYVNAEPCVMCTGATMWSGIKRIFYSIPSSEVEKITGFDEGYKPNWQKEFKKRGIEVYGNIEPQAGEAVMKKYVQEGNKIYKPSR